MKPSRMLFAMFVVLLLSAGTAGAAGLSVNSTAALNSTGNGLEVNTSTSPGVGAYVISTEPNAESHFLARFRIKVPVGFTMPQTANGNYFRIMNFRRTTGPNVMLVVFLKRSVVNGNFRVNLWYRTDAGNFANGGEFFLQPFGSPEDHLIEIEYTQGNGTGNGQLNVKKDGVTQTGFPKTNLDNDLMPVDEVYFGYVYNAGDTANASLSGSYYLDEYESYR